MKMNNIIKNRSEIIFLYDLKYANPNGDPLDSNRPRIDDETKYCLVTDVRLKRTIRDYLLNNGYSGENNDKGDIFIRDINGLPVTGKKRSESYKDIEEFKKKFIDVRLFGGVSAVEKKKFNLTGPVQFGMGKSLHPVQENFIKGTGAFTRKEDAEQKTFREEYNITYGMFGFHGIINENAAKHTSLTNGDVEEFLKAIWFGTKDLITRSKKSHMPRLLIKVDYENSFYIGDLLEMIKIVPNDNKSIESLEDIEDYTLDVEKLFTVLKNHTNNIKNIYIKQDERLNLKRNTHEDKEFNTKIKKFSF